MWSLTFFKWEIECEEVINKRLFLLLVDEICLVIFDVSFVLKVHLGVVWFYYQLSHTTSNVRMQREPCKFAEKIKKWLWPRHFTSKFRRYDLTCIWGERLLRAMAVDTSESTAACVFRRSSLKQGVRCHSMSVKQWISPSWGRSEFSTHGKLAHGRQELVLSCMPVDSRVDSNT